MSAATFRPGDRVRPVSEQPNTWRGTVTDVAVYPARLDDDGAVVLPERTVVTVDVDGAHGPGYAFVADDGQPVPLVRLDDAPSFTVRPIAEASTGSLTFTLVEPDVVGVTNEYGDTVRYPLRDVVAGLLDLWVQTSRDGAAVAR